MANQVAARLGGDDYQHLYGWLHALDLLRPHKQVRLVSIEDPFALSVDDVTVRHEIGASKPDKFYQIKYHVDQRNVYSTEGFLTAVEPSKTSLIHKFWSTWQGLRVEDSARPIELHLVSNWTWDAEDKFRGCIEGRHNSLKEEFITASSRSDLGKINRQWRDVLTATDDEFAEFVRCLRFRVGFDSASEMEERVAERMEALHLRSDLAALNTITGIVRRWIQERKQALSREDLETTLDENNLRLPQEGERCVTIYLTTIKDQKFDIEPDHILDWRDRFVGVPNKKGHQLINPEEWDSVLLPELQALEEQVNTETSCRLVRARGLSRLSAWFAFGHCFSEVARYTIEVDQRGNLWRSDATPSTDFQVVRTNDIHPEEGEILDGEGETVAVGISVTGSLDDDVRDYLANRSDKVAALLLLRPDKELGFEAIQSGGDAVALAEGVKTLTRAFVKRWKAHKLLLFYFGPLSGACFIGHRLNAVCREIQIMEDQQPGYSPSFTLV